MGPKNKKSKKSNVGQKPIKFRWNVKRKLTMEQRQAKLYAKVTRRRKQAEHSEEWHRAKEIRDRESYLRKAKEALKKFKKPIRGDLFVIDEKGKKTKQGGYVVRRWGKGWRVVRERVRLKSGKFKGEGFRRKLKLGSLQERKLGPANRRLLERTRRIGRWKKATGEWRGSNLTFDSLASQIEDVFKEATDRLSRDGATVTIVTEWEIGGKSLSAEITGFLRSDQDAQEAMTWYANYTHQKMADQLTPYEVVTFGSETFTSIRQIAGKDGLVKWDNSEHRREVWKNKEGQRWEKNEFDVEQKTHWKLTVYKLKL